MRRRKINKYKKKLKKTDDLKTIKQEIIISPAERCIYIYKVNKNKKVIEITDVSLEILIEDKFVTIIRYDSSHGSLHRHTRTSMDDSSEVLTSSSVRRRGTVKRWLRWCIEDIKSNFFNYKKNFYKRSKKSTVDIQ